MACSTPAGWTTGAVTPSCLKVVKLATNELFGGYAMTRASPWWTSIIWEQLHAFLAEWLQHFDDKWHAGLVGGQARKGAQQVQLEPRQVWDREGGKQIAVTQETWPPLTTPQLMLTNG